MLYDADQGFGSDVTFADACMAVFVSAKRIQAVIQVDGAQTGKTDDAVKFGENLIQVIDDVIAAIPDMADMVSRRTVVVCSGFKMEFNISAMKAMPVSTPCFTWLPGWKL